MKGDIFPMQLIVTYQLSEEENLWLKNITNHLENHDIAKKIIKDYQKHDKDERYQAVMDIIVKANKETFKEDTTMLEVLEEIFKDKLDEKWDDGKKEGRKEGQKEGRFHELCSLIDDGILTIEQASDRMGMEPEEFLKKKEEALLLV